MKTTILIIGAFLVSSLTLSACSEESSLNNDNQDIAVAGSDVSVTVKDSEQKPNIIVTQLFSLDDVKLRNTKDNCWMIIDKNIYDLSGYDKHPGGEAVFEGCGKDASELFWERPMGSGTPHSDRAQANLDNFKIGELIE